MQQLLPFLELLDKKSLIVLPVIEKDSDSNLKIIAETSAVPLQNINDGLELKFESLFFYNDY
jgi:hypothetical protein